MKVQICKWKHGKQAPFMLMIDDLANKYMVDKLNGDYLGADWGGRCFKENSFYEFIQKELLEKYDQLKLTLFLVVGRRTEIIKNGIPSVSASINNNEEFIEYLKRLCENERIEIAYHGMTHGEIKETGFVQEWELFKNSNEALNVIQKACKLYENTTGKKLSGGKYCGYKSNEFSDESIVKAGFIWWCRHFEGNYFRGIWDDSYALEVEEFDGVIDIPSTVDGNWFSLINHRKIFSREYLKAFLYKMKYGKTIEDVLDYLVSNQLVISIQEHTSPFREDKKRQYPNVIDDISNLHYILDYISKYDIWYATGTEIAEYYKCTCDAVVRINGNILTVATSNIRSDNQILSIEIENNDENILLKNGVELIKPLKIGKRNVFDVVLKEEGNQYQIVSER